MLTTVRNSNMLKASQRRTSSSELKRSLVAVLCNKTTLYRSRNKSWNHEVFVRRPSFAGIHTTPAGAVNRLSSGNNNVALMGIASIAAVGLVGGIYSYTKSISAKQSSETDSLIANQKADWESFHLHSLQYNEEDGDDEDEEFDLQEDDNEDDEEEVFSMQINDNEELEEEDEEDEPTTCSICLINRQGPCRYPWKKFERCIKQQIPSSSSSSSNDDKKVCDPFFIPWLECFSQHRLTYSILTNQSIRPEMDFLEETHGTLRPFPPYLAPTIINLSEQDEEEQLLQDVMTSTVYQRKSLNIPLINPTTGNTIYVAYVRDEPTGDILGFDYFTTELEQLQQQKQQDTNKQLATPTPEAREEGEHELTTENQQNLVVPTTATGELMFHTPVGATSVVVHALYETKIGNDSETAGKDEREQDGHSITKQHREAKQTTENEVLSEKVYVQTLTLENISRT